MTEQSHTLDWMRVKTRYENQLPNLSGNEKKWIEYRIERIKELLKKPEEPKVNHFK